MVKNTKDKLTHLQRQYCLELDQVVVDDDGGEVRVLHWMAVDGRVIQISVGCSELSEGLTGIFCVQLLRYFVGQQ